MKKALIVTSTAGFANGFLRHDMLLLQQMGYEVHCAANEKGTVTFKAEELFPSLGVTFHQIDFSSGSPLSKETIAAYKQVRELILEHHFDFIHCHTPVVGAVVRFAARKARRKGCKVLYTPHGFICHDKSGLKTKIVYGGVEWLCAHWCDGIVSINREDHNKVIKWGCTHPYYINGMGVDTKRFHSVAIDRSVFRKSMGVSDDDIMILAVGRLAANKNQQIILKALAHLNDKRYVFVLCGSEIAGSGTQKHLAELSQKLGVRTVFLGFRKDVPEVTSCADIAVLPSLKEGLGFAGIEALSSGVPVVGAAVQGIKDYVIDGKTGYLCDPMDEKQFAQRILELSDPAVREKMRPHCIEKAEEFSTDVSYRQMEEIYRDLLCTQ